MSITSVSNPLIPPANSVSAFARGEIGPSFTPAPTPSVTPPLSARPRLDSSVSASPVWNSTANPTSADASRKAPMSPFALVSTVTCALVTMSRSWSENAKLGHPPVASEWSPCLADPKRNSLIPALKLAVGIEQRSRPGSGFSHEPVGLSFAVTPDASAPPSASLTMNSRKTVAPCPSVNSSACE